MNRRQFLLQTAAGGLSAQMRKPNLLFIAASQWRAQTLPSSGDRQLIAPNLARLANEGVQFDRVYASYPLSAPSRASMITGKFPHACGVTKNDVQLRAEEPSIAVQLKAAGYSTGSWAADEATPEHQTDLAADFIRQNKPHPFFLFLALSSSGGPPDVETAGLYDPQQFKLRENIPAASEEEARKSWAIYYGRCTALDRCVGRLLKTLDDEALTRDTIVVFTSDHGDMLGSQGLQSANVPYEESARVPLIIRHPVAFSAGSRNDSLISNVDYVPTLLSLCGAKIPEGVQGRDFKGSRAESIFAEGKMGVEGEWRMVVRGLDKYVVNRRFEVTHLYNLGQDPFEMENLALGRVSQRKQDELAALLLDWRKRTGDGLTPAGLRKRA